MSNDDDQVGPILKIQRSNVESKPDDDESSYDIPTQEFTVFDCCKCIHFIQYWIYTCLMNESRT